MMSFNQFLNESWKTDMSEYDWMEPRFKNNAKKRFNDHVLNDRELNRYPNSSGHNGIAYIFGQANIGKHVSTETDDLYYPLIDPKKLNATKQWLLACWEIFTKDFIEKVDNYKGAHLEFHSSDHYIKSDDFQSLVTDGAGHYYRNRKPETPATKKYAKNMTDGFQGAGRPKAYRMVCDDFSQAIIACYSNSKDRKEMELFCSLWGVELEKRLNSIVKAQIELSNARTKHHNKFAKEIGHVKGEHKEVHFRLIPPVPGEAAIQSQFDDNLGVPRVSDAIGYDLEWYDDRPKAPRIPKKKFS